MAVSDRTLIARIAAAERWAREPDRTRAMSAARAGLQRRFEREADPAGVLSADELAVRVKSVKTAYYARLALSRRRPSRKAA
jgi:hypothetical protein